MPSDGSARPCGLPPALGEGPGEADALLLLRCLLGITPRRLHALLWQEGSARGARRAIEAGQAGSDTDRAFLAAADPTAIRGALRGAGARFAPPGHPDYWAAFLRLEDPPVGVFVRGHPVGLAEERVAVIGSRRPTTIGRRVAMDIGHGLAMAGAAVVSGAAVGVDAAAHRGALDANGRTIAVLGAGIDVIYPAANRDLLSSIAHRGTIVSEYPPGVPAEPHRFPARNRLIAALSRAVVVVEGTERSGTRITAEHASELGLDVFAVPGSVTSPLSETPLALLRDGATPIRGVEDLLHDLGRAGVVLGSGSPDLPASERLVFDALRERMLPEAVAAAVGCTLPEAVAVLIALEMRGLVRGVGGRFERAYVGTMVDRPTA